MVTFAQVSRQAKSFGYQLDTVRAWLNRDCYWLVTGPNWASYEPGRTLAEIKAQLDRM